MVVVLVNSIDLFALRKCDFHNLNSKQKTSLAV